VNVPAAKRTAEIPPAPISRVGDEQNPAMATARKAAPQVRFVPQNGPEDEIVGQDEIADRALAVPCPGKLKMSLNFYSKKAKLSPMMLMYVCMPWSYQNNSTPSRGKVRAFSFGATAPFSEGPP
jgi:hypothetical protein